MEKVGFWYSFEDEDGDISNHNVDMEISNEHGVGRDDVCETFVNFLAAAGYSVDNLSKVFDR